MKFIKLLNSFDYIRYWW